MKNEYWPEEAGPKCTEEQAVKLFRDLIEGQPWPNRRDADTPAVAAVFLSEFRLCAYEAADRGVRRALREQEYFPMWATLFKYIDVEWKLAGKTWWAEGWKDDGAEG